MPKKSKVENLTKQYTLRAKRNHFTPGGQFVKQGTDKEVGGAEVDQLLNTGNWMMI